MQDFLMNFKFQNDVWAFILPLCLMLFDIITGYIQALIHKSVSSKKMREGLLHKFLNSCILFISCLFNLAFNSKYFVTGVSIYICVMEIVSILENLKKAGIKIDFYKKIFSGKEK